MVMTVVSVFSQSLANETLGTGKRVNRTKSERFMHKHCNLEFQILR